jgi:hypothetical protein
VVQAMPSSGLYGMLRIIESQWMTLFEGNTFRDIQRLSWKTIPADNEHALFVGASVTPKTVSAKIYDVLIFFQSNWIAFLQAGSNDIYGSFFRTRQGLRAGSLDLLGLFDFCDKL